MPSQALDSAIAGNYATDKSQGYLSHGRYLTGKYALTTAEIAKAKAAKAILHLIFEVGAQSALGGAVQGAADGKTAVAAAQKLGAPKGVGIYATVDFEPSTQQLVLVADYIKAFSAAIRAAGYKSGCYGGASVMAKVNGLVDYRWQTAAWSGEAAVTGCHLYQGQFVGALFKVAPTITVGGVPCDINVVKIAQFGQWSFDPPAPAPKPVPKPTPAPAPKPVPETADQYAAANGMVRMDVAEARQAIAHGISYYTWNGKKMLPSRLVKIPTNVVLYGFASSLDAAHIPHAGA